MGGDAAGQGERNHDAEQLVRHADDHLYRLGHSLARFRRGGIAPNLTSPVAVVSSRAINPRAQSSHSAIRSHT